MDLKVEICRICATSSNLLNIFDEIAEEIFQKFQIFNNISFSEDDGLPEFICIACSVRLDSCKEFYDLILRSQKNLSQLLKRKCPKLIQNDEESSKSDMKTEELEAYNCSGFAIGANQIQLLRTDDDNFVTEEDDNKDNNDLSSNQNDILEENVNRIDDEYVDGEVLFEEYTEEYLVEKLETENSNETYEASSPLINIREESLIIYQKTCSLCNEHFQKNDELKAHQIKVHANGVKPRAAEEKKTVTPPPVDRKYQCEFCSKQFATARVLKWHIYLHTNEQPYQCEICKRRFPCGSHLKRHSRCHTGEKPFTCNICEKPFTLKENRDRHETVAHALQESTCPYCDEKFSSTTNVFKHMKKKHKTVKVKTPVDLACSMCSKRFSKISHLRSHESVHRAEKFKCEICEKLFSSKTYLRRHQRIHTGERPLDCPYCTERFASGYALRKHKETSHEDRVFDCAICDKTFEFSRLLENHMKTHAENRQLSTCDICGKSFKDKRSLKLHQNLHIVISKPLDCPECDEQFTEYLLLRKHKRLQHKSILLSKEQSTSL